MSEGAKAIWKEEYQFAKGYGFDALEWVIDFSCMGCGLCVAVCPGKAIGINVDTKKPALIRKNFCNYCGACYMFCPRTTTPLTDMYKKLVGKLTTDKEKRLGGYTALFSSRAADHKVRGKGAPAGTTTALVQYLFDSGRIQRCLMTRAKHNLNGQGMCIHPEPYVATRASVYQSQGTKFEISPILMYLNQLRDMESAIVGTPCQIFAIRRMQFISQDDDFQTVCPNLSGYAYKMLRGIKYLIGIHCFMNFTNITDELMALGIPEKYLVRFNENIPKAYRAGTVKHLLKHQAISTHSGEHKVNLYRVAKNLMSGCLLCQDPICSVFADVSIGFYGGWQGAEDPYWNLTIAKNLVMQNIFLEMREKGLIQTLKVIEDKGRKMRKLYEFIFSKLPDKDRFGCKDYLKTGKFKQGAEEMPEVTYKKRFGIDGLERLFMAQFFRQKFFLDGPRKTLDKMEIYLPKFF